VIGVNALHKRIKRLRETFQHCNIDCMIVMKPENRRYVSGFTGSAGIAIITENEAFLVTDFRYVEQAEQESAGYRVVKHGDRIMDTLKEIVLASGCASVGFEKDYVTFANYELLGKSLDNVTLKPTENAIESLRAVKDQEEIDLISRAAAIADSAFVHMCSVLKPGITEKDAAVELEYYMRQKGSQRNSFPPIIASGPRASLPHAQPTDRVVQTGDMVKMDFGGTFGGYCSDLTRTVFIGSLSEKQKRIYQIVLESQLLAIEGVTAGKKGTEIDGIARKHISENGFGEYFGHGLGHGVGLYIHESPRLSQTSTDTLQSGNIVTIEPGIYIPDWGGVRIEDMLVVKEDGYLNLTHASKEIIII
jgi:Xaa-Pro aminopeptidase